MKNIQASIQSRLRNISRDRKMDFVLISRLYMQEGLLRRISKSDYKSSFLLKGGLLLYSVTGFSGRPTQDIDFLGKNISGDIIEIQKIIKEIVSIKVDDGLEYLPDSLQISTITEGAEYHGQRIKIICKLGNIRTNLKMDIGFGDAVYPEPVEMDYPNLLNSTSFQIQAYSLESVIAEKFHAMIILDARNSRMKDFYDIYSIFIRFNIDEKILLQAVKHTFITRKTITPESPAIFSKGFAQDARNVTLWSNFLKRIKAEPFELVDVIELIKNRLHSIYLSLL